MKVTFTTKVIQAEGKNATGIRVPADLIAQLNSGKRPRVKVTIADYTYRTTVAAYGDVFMIPLSAEHRAGAGVQANDEVDVTLELDTEPRTVDVPDDLASALAENNLTDLFDDLSHSKRKEFVRQVESAKAQDTRERRINKIVTQLSEKD